MNDYSLRVRWIVIPADLVPTEEQVAQTRAEEAEQRAKYDRNLAELLATNPDKDWKGEGYWVNEDGIPILLWDKIPVIPSKAFDN